MKFDYEHVAERITVEIFRVSAKRERLMRAARAAGAVGEARPTLYLMDRAMHFAREARYVGCPFAMVEWLRALEDFKD
jgi:hypothetical protein